MSKQEKESIHKHHDKMFKSIMSRPEDVQDFLQNTMPPEISNKLVYSTLSQQDNSYLDKELKEHFADLVYTCNYKSEADTSEEVIISLLFEHKSYPDNFPHVQLMRYMANAYDKQIKAACKKLQPIIPIIFYHGKGKWKYTPFYT